MVEGNWVVAAVATVPSYPIPFIPFLISSNGWEARLISPSQGSGKFVHDPAMDLLGTATLTEVSHGVDLVGAKTHLLRG
eukprot:10107920-Heterocapsa_arctica.AAC.1